MSVVIVDYGSGNLRSVEKAFVRAATERDNATAVVVSADPTRVARADRIVIPGVGSFADCMAGLASSDGMVDAILEAVTERGRPLLGVCVGMQLFADEGHEYVVTKGLGLVPGAVEKLQAGAPHKIPHMGWNTLDDAADHPVLTGIPTGREGWHAYFVHSYVLNAANENDVVARSDHGVPFASIVARDTVVGTQFHPEKSQALGLTLIANFLDWHP